jgi:hypothetical protein
MYSLDKKVGDRHFYGRKGLRVLPASDNKKRVILSILNFLLV